MNLATKRIVIANAVKQSSPSKLDCFAALAMTSFMDSGLLLLKDENPLNCPWPPIRLTLAAPAPANPTTKIDPARDQTQLSQVADSAANAPPPTSRPQSNRVDAHSPRNTPNNWGKSGSGGLKMG